MYRKTILTTSVILGLLMAGCSTTPPRVDALEEARMAINDIDDHPLAETVGAEELANARRALARADAELEDDADLTEVRHDAYLALRHAEVAEQRMQEAMIRDEIQTSEAERNEVLLLAREHDVDTALALAELNAREAQLHERRALSARTEALRAEERAEAAMAENRMLRDELVSMERELADLEAEETVRGLVLTLGDVLFDTDRATLKPGADKTMDRLAAFLEDHPEREIMIEGHTDARGSDAYNEQLSQRRADAVRIALLDRGIAADRLESIGLGEAYPVATNDTVAGRQENRRVEIVISDKDGQFPASAIRDVAAR